MPFQVVDTSVPNTKVEIERFNTRKEIVVFAPITNSGGWKAVACDLQVDAVQTFAGVADLQVIWGYGRIIDNGIGQPRTYQIDVPGPPMKLQWNGYTSTQRLQDYKNVDLPPQQEGLQNRYLIATLIYNVPLPSFAMDSALCNIRFGSLMWNPAPTAPPPGFGDVGEDDNPNWQLALDWVQIGIIAGLGLLGVYVLTGLIDRLTAARAVKLI